MHYRNGLFHKDQLNSEEIITRIRQETIYLYMLILGSIELSEASIKQKEFKALFDSLQKAPEQEQIIRSFLEPHFDAVISEREPFSLPSGDEIVEAVIST